MTKAEIKELMDFFGEKQGITELKIKDKDFEIEIKKYGPCGGSTPQLAAPAPAPQGGSFRNCAAARAAGVRTPIHRGEPAYAPHLDRDNDGVACER